MYFNYIMKCNKELYHARPLPSKQELTEVTAVIKPEWYSLFHY